LHFWSRFPHRPHHLPPLLGGGEGGVDPHPSPREHAQKLEAFLESRTPAGEALRTLHLAMAAEDDDGLTVDLARAVTHPTSPPHPCHTVTRRSPCPCSPMPMLCRAFLLD